MMPANGPRKGFSIIELAVATGLMAVLAMVLTSAWKSIGKATVDVISRAQLAQEMDLAVATLSRDLGGCAVNSTDTGQLNAAPPTRSVATDPYAPLSSIVTLTLDNNDTIAYQLDSANSDAWCRNNLIRVKKVGGSAPITIITVARNVDRFYSPPPNGDDPLTIQIDFSCNYRPTDHYPPTSADRLYSIVKRSCVLVAGKPQ